MAISPAHFTYTNNFNVGSGADGGTGTITASGTGAQTYSYTAGARTCIFAIDKVQVPYPGYCS